MTETIRAGFIPLLDASPLVVAARKGFAEAEGLHLALERETSWATLRDRLAVRHLDVAHILAPMPIAANLGLQPLPSQLVAPMALGFGGNTVTVSRTLWDDLAACGAPGDLAARPAATALARLVAERKRRGEPALVFASVHLYSAHHYQLAYWLASAGVDPVHDVELVVVPPPLMAAALAAGQIDGFCVGEPWGSVAVAGGAGCILTTSAHIWRSSPEKVLGVRARWAEDDPQRLERLIRAVYRAAVWCDDPANREALVALLSEPEALGQPEAVLRPGLWRQLPVPSGARIAAEGLLTFADRAATFPWLSHALWLYAQMVRWGQAPASREAAATAQATFRPDLYRRALTGLGAAIPAADAKREGALVAPAAIETSAGGRMLVGPDDFFDGSIFDPSAVSGVERLAAEEGARRLADPAAD